MAARECERPRRGERVDYHQLHNCSSVVLFDENRRRKVKTLNSRYMVERIIHKRAVQHDHEYLIKWQGWPLSNSTWEPSSHLPTELIRAYDKPVRPSSDRLEQASNNFYTSVLSHLKGKSLLPFYASIELDIWRYISHGKGRDTEHRGHKLYGKEDFSLFNFLPDHWWYFLDLHGEGTAIHFPMKVKPVLSWTPPIYILEDKKLVLAPRVPVEKLSISIVKQACNIQSL